MAKGKRINKAREGVDPAKSYPLDEAVKIVKERAKAKFDETVEVAMNLGVDPRHADQMVRGVVTLPNGTGRTLRVGVFARGPKAEEAKAAGADVVGAEDLVEKVNAGQIDFDRCIATPDMMGLVGRLGKVLGPRGLNIMAFCKDFNAKTSQLEKGSPIPVVITIYADKSFTFEMKTPPMSYFLKKAAKIESGSKTPGRDNVAKVTSAQVREIAEKKMADLNCDTVEAAMRMVEGSARSMGIQVGG